jgi:excisionase family DNA binding protein
MMYLCDLGEMAEKLGVAKSWLYRELSKGGEDPLPAYKFGKYWRFNPEEVFQWAKRQAQLLNDQRMSG